MKVLNYTVLIIPITLLCACANPYSSFYGESPSKLKEDIRFVQVYQETICDIRKKHEYAEISSGKCLALYYDYKDQNHIKDEKKDVVKRVRYILAHPDKFDQQNADLISQATLELADCDEYIKTNCI